MTTPHPTPAAAFDAVAVPLAGSRAAVARVLGISRGSYGSTVHGARDGLRAVPRWCETWAQVRGERIVLEYDPGSGWRARLLTGPVVGAGEEDR